MTTPLVDALTPEQAGTAAKAFQALSDPVRLQLLFLIAAQSPYEANANDLYDLFDLTKPTVSYHLTQLVKAGLVQRERRGIWAFYWIEPAGIRALAALLNTIPANNRQIG